MIGSCAVKRGQTLKRTLNFKRGTDLNRLEIMQSKKAKFGAIFMKGAFSKLKNQMDYQKVGGACLLGIKKIVMKAHGSSTAEAVCASILTACKLKDKKFIEQTAAGIMAQKQAQATEKTGESAAN